MSWKPAAHFAEGATADVALTTTAAGHTPDHVAIASGRTALLWKLTATCCMQIFFYDGSRMSWEQATQFAEGAIADVAWTTPAAGHAPEYVATASGRTASVWKLAGSADKLQVRCPALLKPLCVNSQAQTAIASALGA